MGSMPMRVDAHILPSANKWDETRNLTYAMRAIKHTRGGRTSVLLEYYIVLVMQQ